MDDITVEYFVFDVIEYSSLKSRDVDDDTLKKDFSSRSNASALSLVETIDESNEEADWETSSFSVAVEAPGATAVCRWMTSSKTPFMAPVDLLTPPTTPTPLLALEQPLLLEISTQPTSKVTATDGDDNDDVV